MDLFITFLSALLILFSMTKVLVSPPTRKTQFVILLYVFIVDLLLLPYLHHFSSLFVVAGCLLIIAAFTQPIFLNLTLSLFGYLSMITAKHIVLAISGCLFPLQETSLTGISSLIFALLFCIFTYVFSYFLGWLFRKKLRLHNYPIPDSTYLLLFLAELLCVVIFILNFSFYGKRNDPPALVLINALLFTCFFILIATVLILIIRVTQKNYEAREKLHEYISLESYITELETLYQEMRVFRHDNANMLASIYGYIEEEDMSGLKTYFQESILPEEPSAFSHAEIGKLVNMKVPELKGLIYSKLILGFSKDLHISVSINYPIEHLHTNTADLVKVLGIFLDNAIEACQDSTAKMLCIHMERRADAVTWSICNSCDADIIPLQGITSPNYSSKGRDRGLGLATAEKILSNYPDIYHTTRFFDHIFTQQLENIL